MTVTVHCFLSGGRDSALACYIARQVARQRGWDFRLVHIDTTISIRQTQEYVKQYAEWLGAELVVIRPKKTFREYATQYGMWPALRPQRFRWCYRKLKLEPTVEYIREDYRRGDIVVLGIRKSESLFRDRYYNDTFLLRDYGGVKARVWLPLLRADRAMLERLVAAHGIPQNPVWRCGFSGDCLCLAVAPPRRVATILRSFPEEREMLLEIDDLINRNRRSGRPSAPFRLWHLGYRTLRDFWERAARRQTTLDEFVS